MLVVTGYSRLTIAAPDQVRHDKSAIMVLPEFHGTRLIPGCSLFLRLVRAQKFFEKIGNSQIPLSRIYYISDVS